VQTALNGLDKTGMRVVFLRKIFLIIRMLQQQRHTGMDYRYDDLGK
jgi:hypothetical protein